jgi:hypothetical protein
VSGYRRALTNGRTLLMCSKRRPSPLHQKPRQIALTGFLFGVQQMPNRIDSLRLFRVIRLNGVDHNIVGGELFTHDCT